MGREASCKMPDQLQKEGVIESVGVVWVYIAAISGWVVPRALGMEALC